MAKAPKKEAVLLELVQQYDKIRTEHTQLGKDKEELSGQIKAIIGTRLEVPVEGWRVSYKYDADKTVETFDEETFEKKEPKKYKAYLLALEEIENLRKKYVKTETVSGARRLNITSVEEGE